MLALRFVSDDPLPLKATADRVPEGLRLLSEVPLELVMFHKLAVCPDAPWTSSPTLAGLVIVDSSWVLGLSVPPTPNVL